MSIWNFCLKNNLIMIMKLMNQAQLVQFLIVIVNLNDIGTRFSLNPKVKVKNDLYGNLIKNV